MLRVVDAAGLARVHAIRREVFVDEQGVSLTEEWDDLDDRPGTVHVLAVDDEHIDLGTARLLSEPARPGVVHVTRVAVRRVGRRRGVGRALMTAVEKIALAEHAAGDPPTVQVELSAQETALPFYAALGYEIDGHRYLDAGIWHRSAVKVLAGHVADGLHPPSR